MINDFSIKRNKMWTIIAFLAIGCSNSSSETKINTDTSTIETKIVYPKSINLVSGRYGEMSIGIDSNNNLTGVYEYYDAWDESYKEYMKICKFYFSGQMSKNNPVINIDANWPGTTQKLKGIIKINIINDTTQVGLVLNEIPYGYAAVDFTKENEYVRKLNEKKNWSQINLIKPAKIKLYDFPDLSTVNKAYLIKNDIVKVLSKTDGWYEIEYNPPNDNSKSIIAWIREGDIL